MGDTGGLLKFGDMAQPANKRNASATLVWVMSALLAGLLIFTVLGSVSDFVAAEVTSDMMTGDLGTNELVPHATRRLLGSETQVQKRILPANAVLQNLLRARGLTELGKVQKRILPENAVFRNLLRGDAVLQNLLRACGLPNSGKNLKGTGVADKIAAERLRDEADMKKGPQ